MSTPAIVTMTTKVDMAAHYYTYAGSDLCTCNFEHEQHHLTNASTLPAVRTSQPRVESLNSSVFLNHMQSDGT